MRSQEALKAIIDGLWLNDDDNYQCVLEICRLKLCSFMTSYTPFCEMKKLLIASFVILLALVACCAYVADQLFGVVAFSYRYLLFCIVAAALFGAVWFMSFRKNAILFGLLVFSILAMNFFLPPPSERFLRSAMLKIPPGTEADFIEKIVTEEYAGSSYLNPNIYKDHFGNIERVHVSLLNQSAGNCTSLLFLVEDGVVTRGIYSAD